MSHIIKFQPPGRDAAPVYWPVAYGFKSHALTPDRALAEIHPSEESAQRKAQAFLFPPYFWNSEYRHRQEQERRYRGWTFTVEPAVPA